MKEIQIENKTIGMGYATYFIADVAANHDGDLERAKELVYLCAEAGADAAKFQHFTANTIVSDQGFKSLGGQQSHQSKWRSSVFDVYQNTSIDQDWTPILKETCDKAGITFLTSPYSYELVDKVDNFLSAYKIGSGDITWLGIVEYIASKKKPVLLATGASTLNEVDMAMSTLLNHTDDIVLMQCNTNYTASLENFKYINLNVLKTYKKKYPNWRRLGWREFRCSNYTHGNQYISQYKSNKKRINDACPRPRCRCSILYIWGKRMGRRSWRETK